MGAHRQDLRREARPMTARCEREACELHVLCAGAAQGLVEALAPKASPPSSACASQGRFGAVGAMQEALLAGAPCDVMIVTDAMIETLAASRRSATAGSRAALGRVRTGVAVRAGCGAARRSTRRKALRGGAARVRPRSTSPTRRARPPASTSPTCCDRLGLHDRARASLLRPFRTARPRCASSPRRPTTRRSAARRSPRSATRRAWRWSARCRAVRAGDGLHRRRRRDERATMKARSASSRCSSGEASAELRRAGGFDDDASAERA